MATRYSPTMRALLCDIAEKKPSLSEPAKRAKVDTYRRLQRDGLIVPRTPIGSGWLATPQGSYWARKLGRP